MTELTIEDVIEYLRDNLNLKHTTDRDYYNNGCIHNSVNLYLGDELISGINFVTKE
jgi:hypothetical protein